MEYEVQLVSSLDKVFPNGAIQILENNGFCLKNERYHFQLCIRSKSQQHLCCNVTVESELGERVTARLVECMPGRYTRWIGSDDWTIFPEDRATTYPDLLRPIPKQGIRLLPGQWQTLWITVDGTKETLPVGKHSICISVSEGESLHLSATYILDVVDATLPSSELIYTNWMHYDCLCEQYRCEPFSKRFYEVLESFLSVAVSRGMNMLYIPLFTPALDTEVGGERRTVQLIRVQKVNGKYTFDFAELRKFLAFVKDMGIRYFEMSHLATQWGGKYCPKIVANVDGEEEKIFGWETLSSGEDYQYFLKMFLPALDAFLKEEGYSDNVYFHISDEPFLEHYDGYSAIGNIIRESLKGYPLMDAMSEPKYFEDGLVDIPVVAAEAYEKFSPRSDWAYYSCCSNAHYVSNRFFNMPSIRNRILGAELYETNAKGFLHWGFNFYNAQLSRYPIDPFSVTDADGGFPSGDSFVVYPGKDGALASLRLEVFYDAIQDLCLLRLAEKKLGREELLDRLHAMGIADFKGKVDAETWRSFRLELHRVILKEDQKC